MNDANNFEPGTITGTMHDAACRRLNATTDKEWSAANKALIALVGSSEKADALCRYFVGSR